MKRAFWNVVPTRLRPHYYVKRLVDEALRDGIVSGPFKGMPCVEHAVCGALYPRLLGTYEMELHPVMYEIIGMGFRTVIDIGAAEGYYACGLARQIPETKVLAFEADLRGRYFLNRNIAMNSLQDRVKVRGFCDPAVLAGELEKAQAPVLVICDTEGHEYELLLPMVVMGLCRCSILVELHDFALPGISSIIKERFSTTHRLVEYNAKPRTREDFPIANQKHFVKKLPFRYMEAYLNEHRPPGMSWLWMKPRT